MDHHSRIHGVVHAGFVVSVHPDLTAVAHAYFFILIQAGRQVQVSVRLYLLFADHVVFAITFDRHRFVVLDVLGAVMFDLDGFVMATITVRSFSTSSN